MECAYLFDDDGTQVTLLYSRFISRVLIVRVNITSSLPLTLYTIHYGLHHTFCRCTVASVLMARRCLCAMQKIVPSKILQRNYIHVRAHYKCQELGLSLYMTSSLHHIIIMPLQMSGT